MSYGTPDVYYQPGHFGLEIVGEAERPSWHDFDKFAVWRDAAGALYYASDSGCSCPSPFENFTSLSDLTKATVAEAHAALDEWADSIWGDGAAASVSDLHAKLASLSTSNQEAA